MNVAALDLNLLKAFAALHEHRNVTRAGAAIGLAQPSMSNALSRLRAALGDELFVRSPDSMVPTARADAIAPKIEAALAMIGEAFDEATPFDPATARANVTVAAPDSVVLMLAPELAHVLAQDAPGFDLRFAPLAKETVWSELDRDAVDAAVGRFGSVPARFTVLDGPGDRFVVLSTSDEVPTLADYCASPHVLVSLNAEARGAIDDTLAARGLVRRVALTVAHFAVLPAIVARTGHLATLPERVARAIPTQGCTIHPLPIEQDEWTLQIVVSARANADPAKRYAIKRLAEVLDAV